MSLGYFAIAVILVLVLELFKDPTPRSPVIPRLRIGVGKR
jgi:hypothetical protein